MNPSISNGAVEAPSMKQRITELEATVATHEQHIKRIATALASVIAAQMQPQLQRQLADQLINGQDIPSTIEQVLAE